MSPRVDEPRSKGGFALGDYVEVKDRIRMFYERFTEGALVTDRVELWQDDGVPRIVVKALAYRWEDDQHPGVGWSWLSLPGTTPYTRGSELENCETSAWGRAIGSLGIGIDKSVASKNEIDAKVGDTAQPLPTEGSLIGIVAVQGTQDAELRETPGGWVLPFRVKEGRSSQIVQAHDAIAQALYAYRDTLIGARVEVWGTYSDETLVKGGREFGYRVLHVTKIAHPDFILPAPVTDSPVTPSDGPGAEEAPSVALFPDDLSDLPDEWKDSHSDYGEHRQQRNPD